jgi:hypothetical protein
MTTINDDAILIRGLDVTARLSDSVVSLSDHATDGVLLETLIGRYVLDRDARVVWLSIDGRRSVGQILDSIVETTGMPREQIRQSVYSLCERLLEFGLVENVTPADTAALSSW